MIKKTTKQKTVKKSTKILIPSERIDRSILLIRDQKVLLDFELAELYGVETGNLNKAMKRNIDRFPVDFMFQLDKEEFADLKFQSGRSREWGGRRSPPFAFTEQGVAMLSSVLHSSQAVHVNIEIMRAFVRMRILLTKDQEMSRKLNALEKKYDSQFNVIFDAIRQLMMPPTPAEKKRKIGFLRDQEE